MLLIQKKKDLAYKTCIDLYWEHFASSKVLPEYIYYLCKFFMLSIRSKLGKICEVYFNIADIPLFCGLCRLQYTVRTVLFSSGAF